MLETAIWRNNVNDAKKALGLGADPNTIGLDLDMNVENGTHSILHSILSIACFYGQCEIADMLIKAGADVNAGTDIRWTPLMWGAYVGFIEGMALLVDAGADTSIKNNDGQTAFDMLKEEHPEKYNLWISKMKKNILKQEDCIKIDTVCYEPDFGI